jgi:hypothetical protein
MWRVTRKQIMKQKASHVPYTTKTGLKIGLAYQPKPQELTPDGEFIQSVLLGRKTSLIRRNGMMLYTVLLAAVFALITVVVNK